MLIPNAKFVGRIAGTRRQGSAGWPCRLNKRPSQPPKLRKKLRKKLWRNAKIDEVAEEVAAEVAKEAGFGGGDLGDSGGRRRPR